MIYKCKKRCTFKGRIWDTGDIYDFGKENVPHHFVKTDEIPTVQPLSKEKIDIQAAVSRGVKASTFYEISNNKLDIRKGFASTLEKEEVIMHPSQLKVKK